MCGRFVVAVSKEEMDQFIKEHYNTSIEHEYIVPRYNVAPTQDIFAIIKPEFDYRAGTLKWGLIPSFSKDKKMAYNMINARVETLDSKVSYKKLIQSKRCIILSSGYYEWKKEGNIKTPYLITVKGVKLFAFAGLWDKAVLDGETIFSATIITKNSDELISHIHDRMPLILDPHESKLWLSDNFEQLLNKDITKDLQYKKVSKYVNKVSNDDHMCIE